MFVDKIVQFWSDLVRAASSRSSLCEPNCSWQTADETSGFLSTMIFLLALLSDFCGIVNNNM